MKIIIANWKMQLNYRQSLLLTKKFVKKIKKTDNQVVICPSYLSLTSILDIVKNKKIEIGAQDCSFASQGSYTGEVSPANLQTIGVKYVIIGHSERRRYQKEDGKLLNKKIKEALENKLIPILCIGEDLNIKKNGETRKFLSQQLKQSLKGVKIKKASDIIIAYEPLWAIGSGQVSEPEKTNNINIFIKEIVKKMLNKKIMVLYGGSVDDKNFQGFLKYKNIDGLLIGGASLNVNKFSKIC